MVVIAPDGKTKKTYTIEVTLHSNTAENSRREWGEIVQEDELPTSGLFVLTAEVVVNDDPQASGHRWISLLIIPAALVCWAIFLVLHTVGARLARGRRQHRGLINDTTATLADFTVPPAIDHADSRARAGAADSAASSIRLTAVACPASDGNRLRSLDMLRGIALCLMMFCNGDTGYPELFEPSRTWVGFPTVADMVAPGFTWCMGFSLALVADMTYSRHATKAALFHKVALRAICLLVIALAVERTGHSKGLINFLTPLTRLSAVYFVVGATLVATP